jgi:hypothetical protein
MKSFSVVVILAAFALFSFSGCGESRAQQKQAAQAVMEVGKIENNTYSNSYFGMSIHIPEGWYIAPNETMEQLQKTGVKAVTGDNKALQTAIEAAPSVNLFGTFEKPPGSPVDFNPSVLSVAEKVTAMPGIKKGADYLFHAKKLLLDSTANYKAKDETRTVQVGGRSFDVLELELQATPKVKVKQEYYATIDKGYAISIILSYVTDEQKSKVEAVLNTLKFQN